MYRLFSFSRHSRLCIIIGKLPTYSFPFSHVRCQLFPSFPLIFLGFSAAIKFKATTHSTTRIKDRSGWLTDNALLIDTDEDLQGIENDLQFKCVNHSSQFSISIISYHSTGFIATQPCMKDTRRSCRKGERVENRGRRSRNTAARWFTLSHRHDSFRSWRLQSFVCVCRLTWVAFALILLVYNIISITTTMSASTSPSVASSGGTPSPFVRQQQASRKLGTADWRGLTWYMKCNEQDHWHYPLWSYDDNSHFVLLQLSSLRQGSIDVVARVLDRKQQWRNGDSDTSSSSSR